jgi:hypothetical protein
MEALTRVCTSVANLDMDKRKDEMAFIKGKKKTVNILIFSELAFCTKS